MFAWFSPYFDAKIELEKFNVMTTIELDSTFTALEPYTIRVPTIIYWNSSIPLGLLASTSESTSVYSLFFESLKELDKKKPDQRFSYYQKINEKKYLIAQHKSFIELVLYILLRQLVRIHYLDILFQIYYIHIQRNNGIYY